MSLSPFELVKSHYDANERGDLAGMLAPLAPDVAWTEMEGFPLGGTYVGPDAIRTASSSVSAANGSTTRPHSTRSTTPATRSSRPAGTPGTYPPTGNAMRCRFAHVWHVADGAVVAFEQFTDTRLVAAAMTHRHRRRP